MVEADYIIVGQGLAGSAVAVQLLREKKRIVVIDDASANHSSRIAAGLFNPVTGKKMVKTWMADQLFPYLHTFYREVEQSSGQNFFHSLPLYRPFISVEEQNEWMGRSSDPHYSGYIQEVVTSPRFKAVSNEFGGLLLKQCGFLNTEKFIDAVRILIRQNGTLMNELFDGNDLGVSPENVKYRNYTASRIIFCSGTHTSTWFNWLPIQILKGETISIRNDFTEKIVMNRGVYMVPEDDAGTWKVGATYHFTDQTPEVTEEAKAELMEKVEDLTNLPFTVFNHAWGFRPTTPDRRPILGAHPENERVIVFNGLGTKGVSLAPYFSEVLIHWLENRGSINKEVDIKRFKSVYSGSPK